MSEYIWLSHPLAVNDPRPPAIPAPKLEPLYTIENDDANVQILTVASHTGTHVDSPLHVAAEGISIHEFSAADFIFGSPVVIDLSLADEEVVMPEHLMPFAAEMQNADIVLFRFGYASVRNSYPERFSEKCPGFGNESTRWLRKNFQNLRAIGMDVPSLACIAHLDETMAAHNELLGGVGRRFFVIEDMDLAKDLSGLREVRLNPWLVTDMDSGPCSVVGLID